MDGGIPSGHLLIVPATRVQQVRELDLKTIPHVHPQDFGTRANVIPGGCTKPNQFQKNTLHPPPPLWCGNRRPGPLHLWETKAPKVPSSKTRETIWRDLRACFGSNLSSSNIGTSPFASTKCTSRASRTRALGKCYLTRVFTMRCGDSRSFVQAFKKMVWRKLCS